MRRRTRVWLQGLVGGTLCGIGTSVGSWFTLALAGQLGSPMTQLTFGQLGVVAVAGAIVGGTAYYAKSPRPNPLDDTAFTTAPK